MGLFGRLFGGQSGPKSASSASTDKISYLGVLRAQNKELSVTTKRCDDCGRTFPFPSNCATVFGLSISGWALDAGGYCPQCRQYLCPSHAKLREIQGSDQEYENGSYRPACSKCGTYLSYPQIDLIRVGGGKKRKTSIKNALEERGIQVTARTCKECGITYPHPMNDYLLAPADSGVRIEEVEVDLGGFCQCCQYFVCPKHAKLSAETNPEGVTFWQVECATCEGYPLIAAEKPLEMIHPDMKHTGCHHKMVKEAIASAMAQFAKPSKRFAFQSSAIRQGQTLVDRKCDLCGDPFKLTKEMYALQVKKEDIAQHSITDEDFFLDLGGYCLSCRKHLCPKHAQIFGADVEGGRILAIACATCEELLVPNAEFKV